MWRLWLPMFGLLIIIGILAVCKDRLEQYFEDLFNKRERAARYKDLKTLEDLRNLTGAKFEEYIAHLFERLGYRITMTGGSHDGGIDLVATRDGKDHYIQCKKYTNNKVSVGAVRDFYGAIADKQNAEGHFITTQFFTPEARYFAEGKPIDLIDQFRLLNLIKLARGEEASEEICPKCSSLLVPREGRFGKFIGCSNYPKCDYSASIR